MVRLLSNSRSRYILAAALLAAPVFIPNSASPFTRVSSAGEVEPVPPNVRDSIDKGLAYLAKDQKPDGTFTQGAPAGTTAVPSLVVLAFLSRGHVPGKGEYGEMLNRSIDYVLDSQQETGLFSRRPNADAIMYEHGMSAVMLGEAYPNVDDVRRAKILKAVARSTKLLLDAQEPDGHPKNSTYAGGWRYRINSSDADISVSAWQILALRAAARCGVDVPKRRLEAARAFIDRCAVPTGGFAYQPGGLPNSVRTGVGVLMDELVSAADEKPGAGKHPANAVAGGDYLLGALPDSPRREFYFDDVFFCAHSLEELGGKYWDKAYAPRIRTPLLALQKPDGHFDGSNGQEKQAGPAYGTAMACLTLCVPYDNLPVFLKDK
ncbi:MAG TPA: prenyltransferase/squalene oxidase repeat-containing protein [Tepidisphaeraceae bacterium]|jgi:prenyltransferase beta subunit|nr:prenyltransferase/squalene oxidase repeat-containing protein [Tepidisphaeraceae bacterium]